MISPNSVKHLTYVFSTDSIISRLKVPNKKCNSKKQKYSKFPDSSAFNELGHGHVRCRRADERATSNFNLFHNFQSKFQLNGDDYKFQSNFHLNVDFDRFKVSVSVTKSSFQLKFPRN